MQPGKKLRQALTQEQPLQLVGAINAYSALQAERAGFKAIYLSGAGVANAAFALPDLGVTTLADVEEEVTRICQAVTLPLVVDADTGWDDVAQTVRVLESAGAAGLHLEDQVAMKRCGHRPGKTLVSKADMQQRIKQAVAARTDNDFVIIARTDAHAVEGLQAAIERAQCYIDVGADLIFAEALQSLAEFEQFVNAVTVPVMANITEFGQTPLFTLEQLRQVGVGVVLYPLTAFRMMNAAAAQAYQVLRHEGTQQSLIDNMQTRVQLYDVLNYEYYETDLSRLDEKRRI